MEKLNFSEIVSDLSKKYIFEEKIKPREFMLKLCECENEQFDQFNLFDNSSRLVKNILSSSF